MTQTRKYQLEIFEEAKQRNVIAFLPTGSGKTQIALELIKHFVDDKSQKKLKIFFLVPTVPLVAQQALQIRRFVRVKVIESSGNKPVKAKDLESNKSKCVFVTTPALLREWLQHAFVNMKEIALIVFDECHHTSGDHEYNKIMREYYFQVPQNHRPRILGLTASPGILDGMCNVCYCV